VFGTAVYMHNTRGCHVRAVCRDGWLGELSLRKAMTMFFGVIDSSTCQAQVLPLSQSVNVTRS
jgi:hypothetical protein